MMIFKNINIIILIALLAIQAGCKGKKGEAGPAGPTDTNIGLSADGSYIKGTVTTTTSTAKAVSFSFNDTYADSYNYFGGNGSYTSQTLYKNYAGANSGLDDAYVEFVLDSIADPTPSNFYIQIDATTLLSSDSTFSFYIDGNPTLSNYKYDAATRTASGDYTITNTNTNNGNSATVTGSFKLINLKTVVYRQGAQN